MPTITSSLKQEFHSEGYKVLITPNQPNNPKNTDLYLEVHGGSSEGQGYGGFTQQNAYDIIKAVAESTGLNPKENGIGHLVIDVPLTEEQTHKDEIANKIFNYNFIDLTTPEKKAVVRIYELESAQ